MQKMTQREKNDSLFLTVFAQDIAKKFAKFSIFIESIHNFFLELNWQMSLPEYENVENSYFYCAYIIFQPLCMHCICNDALGCSDLVLILDFTIWLCFMN